MTIAKLLGATLLGLALLTGCDAQRISELQSGQSTEADVRDRFGVPENTWPEPGGGHTLEYNRQPAGTENFMASWSPCARCSRKTISPVYSPAWAWTKCAASWANLRKPRALT